MAIAKMKKVTLISFHEKKDQLLQSIQALQSFEVVDLPSADLAEKEAVPNQLEALDSTIKDLEKDISQVQSVLSFMQSYLPKTPMMKKLREKKQEFSLEELETEVSKFSPKELIQLLLRKEQQLDDLSDEQKRLSELEMFLSNWKKLNYNSDELQQMQYVSGSVGTIPQHVQNVYMQGLRQNDLLLVKEVYQNDEEHGIAVYFDPRDEQAVQQSLQENLFQNLDDRLNQDPSTKLEEVKQKLKENKKAKADLVEALQAMKKEEWQLMLTEEYFEAKLQRERSKQLLIDEKHLFIMDGWLEEERIPNIKDTLKGILPQEMYALMVEDVKDDEVDDVPIVLKNNKFVSPFESITSMYNLPKYNEIDPTPFLAPFYLVFFGMMAADIGYGLLLWLATFGAMKFFHFDKSMEKNIFFFHLLSYPTMLWGVVYGSIFGAELPFILLSTTNDVITIMLISVIFGVIQIIFGLSIATYLRWRDNKISDAFADGLGWIGIFVGIILIAIGILVIPNDILVNVGAIISISSALGIIIATMLGAENKPLGIGLGVYNIYGITGYVGDIVSYTRLMALGVSSGSIALAFNMIIGFIPGWGRFTVGILLFIVLHAVNLGLTMLSAYVHGARLIFVEFFGKFYEGGGKALNPLKVSEKHIQLKDQKES
ncbi:V/A-type H+-transporting ATPase subunit I [Natronobacillus azotifigens]|uniref:V-type ATP synthase subunit I n=1 Tax=Natronobacillus azotifigens TaxID=472978 RepID=A0A9J6R9K3_9BACI|nr:V-type ATP synthase subunit I [Natronobacillus azotifigens]MCZ0701979.1 V-type ATP synthase subunit I [Natronobacillus azotifigens]